MTFTAPRPAKASIAEVRFLSSLRRVLPSLQTFRRVVIVVGLVAIALLLWKLDARVVLRTVSHVGFGIFLILALEIVTITLNAIGWRLSFAAAEAPAYRIGELGKLWVAMDGINYLIPTGTIAGEVARTSMLNESHPVAIRTSSAVLSRFSAQVAQIVFILTGVIFLVSDLRRLGNYRSMPVIATVLLAFVSIGALIYALGGYRWIAASESAPTDAKGMLRSMSLTLRRYLGRHPWRLLASICVFLSADSSWW